MKPWVKLHVEIIDDPDQGTLTLAQRGVWSMLLALAGFVDDRDEAGIETGRLDTPARVAWRLRVSLPELEEALGAFQERGMVDLRDDGALYLPNYGRRQAAMPVGERVQRHRDRKRKDEYYGTDEQRAVSDGVTVSANGGNGTVTNRYTEIDIEIEGEREGEVDAEQRESALPPPARPKGVREMFVEVFGEEPEPATLERLSKCPDMDLLGDVMRAWAEENYNPQNVDGMAQWYKRGWRHGKPKGKNGSNGTREAAPADYLAGGKCPKCSSRPCRCDELSERAARLARGPTAEDRLTDAWEKAYMHVQAYMPALRRPLEGAEPIGISEDGERVRVRPAEECRVLFQVRPGLVGNARNAGLEVVLDE